MLQLAGRVALGMDVADLLELERPLERGRVGVAPPDEHEPARVDVAAGELGHAGTAVERDLGLLGQAPQRRAELELLLETQPTAGLGDGRGDDDQSRDLGHERLRGGDGDLRTGLQEEDRPSLAGDRRADGVGHRDDRTAALAGEAGRGDRVGRLARLGHRDDQGPLVERRGAVAELRADVGPGRDPHPVLDGGRADQRGVIGRAAGDQLDPIDRPEGLGQAVELGDLDPVVGGHPPGQRLEQGGRLLVHLLEHEVLVAALLGGLGRPVDGADRALDRRAGQVGDDHAPGPEVGDVALLEEDDPVGMGQDRRHVAGQEALAVADPDDERDVQPGADQPVRLAPVHDRQGVRAVELAQGGPDRVGQVAGVGLLDEVGDRLGVGLRGQRVAPCLEPVAQLAEVLDDPVVDDRDVAGAVLVRVGIEVVGPAVGRPAGMGQADRRVRGPVGDGRLEVGQLARPLLDEQVAGVVDQGDPGRVVAAILESAKALDQDRTRLTRSGIADDPTHSVRVS